MSQTVEWWDCLSIDIGTPPQCCRVTSRRPAAWRCLSFKSPPADNRCPHKIYLHHHHYHDNYTENRISRSRISLCRLFLFSSSRIRLHFLYVISYLFIYKPRHSLSFSFPAPDSFFILFIFPMFSSLVPDLSFSVSYIKE